MRVVAAPAARFDGAQLLEALRGRGLRRSAATRSSIACTTTAGRSSASRACASRARSTSERWPTTTIRGVALFAVLPGPLPAADAFDELIFTARALAAHLGGHAAGRARRAADRRSASASCATRCARVRARARRRRLTDGPADGAPATPPDASRELREQIERHNYRYYVLDDPEISDAQLRRADARAARSSRPRIPNWSTPDSPTQRVGGAPSRAFGEVVHAVPMLSLDNAFSEQDVLDFDRRVRERLDVEAVEYSAEPKIDGLAISLRYEAGPAGAGRDARRRHARRGRHRQRARHPLACRSRCAAQRCRRCSRCAARSS